MDSRPAGPTGVHRFLISPTSLSGAGDATDGTRWPMARSGCRPAYLLDRASERPAGLHHRGPPATTVLPDRIHPDVLRDASHRPLHPQPPRHRRAAQMVATAQHV